MRRLSTVHARRSPVHARRAPRAAPGFTLVEMLVVIGILAVLTTLIGVVVSKARGGATKFQLAAQLQAISVGLEAYKDDFKAYPASSNRYPLAPSVTDYDYDLNREGLRGARMLCKMLMGAGGGQSGTIINGGTYALDRGNQDGKVGLGFSTPGRTGVATVGDDVGNMNGKTFGPYLAPDKFRVANTATDPITISGVPYAIGDVLPGKTYDDRAVLLDANDHPILYFPLMNQQVTATLPFAYLSQGRADGIRDTGAAEVKGTGVTEPVYAGTPAFNGVDNAAWLPTPVLRFLLGDTDLSGRYEAALSEKIPARGQYILWTAGPDGRFGPRKEDGAAAGTVPTVVADKVAELKAAVGANRFDDVTNLTQ